MQLFRSDGWFGAGDQFGTAMDRDLKVVIWHCIRIFIHAIVPPTSLLRSQLDATLLVSIGLTSRSEAVLEFGR